MTRDVLVILPNNPGDVVMALQAIARLKSDWSGLNWDYLVSEECQILVQGSPALRQIHVIPRRQLKACASQGDFNEAIAGFDEFLQELAKTDYLLSLNLFQEPYGGVIQSFVSAQRKIGLELSAGRNYRIESRYMEHLAAIPACRGDNGWHAVDLYIRAAGRVLTTLLSKPAAIGPFPPGTWAETCTELLPRISRPKCGERLLPGQFLAFHPGSAWPGKCWPEKHWALLANLCHQAGLEIAFTGAREELPVLDRILKSMETEAAAAMVLCVGETSLLELAWLTGNASLVVTGDTVAMHLAAITGTPTLALFGPSNPVETGPYGRGHVILQTGSDPGQNFLLAEQHAGLTGLNPASVANYILSGEIPTDTQVWQTDWDTRMGMQVLRNSRQELHPAYARAKPLMQILDQGAGTPLDGLPILSGVRENLRVELGRAISDPNPAALKRLEEAEHALARDTQGSLIWEAYRIALNGLSLTNLPTYLTQRQSRYFLALQEEASAIASHAP